MGRISFRLRLLLPLLLAAVAALACGGGEPSDPRPPQSGVIPPETKTAPTATPDNSFAVIPKAIPVTPPQDASEQLLGLPPDREASKRLRAALAASGLALGEGALYVLPVRGSQEVILLFGLKDAVSLTDKTMVALMDAAAADPAGITRLTFDIRGEDSKGRFRLTMAAPLAAMKAMVAGDSSPDLAKQMVYSLKYEGQ
jgi:hypothetical protein